MPTKTECVLVEMSQYDSPVYFKFDSLREAMKMIATAIDFNHAAPTSLTMPANVIGQPPVTFDTMQLYLMAQLVRDD